MMWQKQMTSRGVGERSRSVWASPRPPEPSASPWQSAKYRGSGVFDSRHSSLRCLARRSHTRPSWYRAACRHPRWRVPSRPASSPRAPGVLLPSARKLASVRDTSVIYLKKVARTRSVGPERPRRPSAVSLETETVRRSHAAACRVKLAGRSKIVMKG